MEAAQAQKHVTHNEALRSLDGVVQLSVLDRDLTSPPGSPADGDRYIVASGATGAWAGKDLNIAFRQDGAWKFLTPREGWRSWVEDEGVELIYDNSNWYQLFGARTPHGACSYMPTLEEELTLSGANVTSTIQIPAGSWYWAVPERVTQTVTGATSFKVGISGELSKFGDGLSLSSGSTNFGLIGGQAAYSNTPIIVTANGSNFTGGKVRIAIQCLKVVPPTS